MKTILTEQQMKHEILESHERSRAYGVCREKRSVDQKKLSPGELEDRRAANPDLLDVASEYIEEFYELLSPDRFMIAVVDAQGYILSG